MHSTATETLSGPQKQFLCGLLPVLFGTNTKSNTIEERKRDDIFGVDTQRLRNFLQHIFDFSGCRSGNSIKSLLHMCVQEQFQYFRKFMLLATFKREKKEKREKEEDGRKTRKRESSTAKFTFVLNKPFLQHCRPPDTRRTHDFFLPPPTNSKMLLSTLYSPILYNAKRKSYHHHFGLKCQNL